MPSPQAFPSRSSDAALALFLPLVERLDAPYLGEAMRLAEALRDLRRDPAALLPPLDDKRLDRAIDLMRQGFAREATGEGTLFPGWSDLHNHLRFSYAPLGRALGEMHSEAAIALPPLETLLLAIGLVSILQEAPQRFRDTHRLLLPVQWFPAGTSIETWLNSHKRSAALDTAYANGLSRLNELLNAARRGLGSIHNDALRQGATASLFLLGRLQKRLAQRTPNVRPVAINAWDRLLLRWQVGK